MGRKLCKSELAPLYLRRVQKTIANYINPYIGGVALNQLTPAMVDKNVSADY